MPNPQENNALDGINKFDDHAADLRAQLIWEPCKSKSDLDLWLRGVLGVYLARKPIVEGNSSPLDFLWDCYSSALYGRKYKFKDAEGKERIETLKFTEKPNYDLVGIAGRGSQKSLTCGVLELMLLLHDSDRDLFHMASIREQSRVTYRYIKTFLNKPHMNGTVRRTIESLTEGIRDNILQIGTGTMDSVNSFHGSVIQDEVDLTDRVVFNESSGMLSPTKDSRMPINVAISSRKFAFGNIQALLDHREERDLTIHQWGLLENTERCPDSRSGRKKVDIWVDVEGLVHLSQAAYDALEENDYKKKFVKMQGYEGCVQCPIFSFCQGKLKKQDKDNPHLIPIELAIKYFKREDPEFFKAQRLNRRPSRKGLVYPQYLEGIHVRNYAGMWEMFFGVPCKDKDGKLIHVTKPMLIDAMRKKGVERYIAVDFGFNNGHMLLCFVDGSENVYVLDEITTEQKSDAEMAKLAWDTWGPIGIDLVYPDSASPGGMKEFEKIGFTVCKEVVKTEAETKAGMGTVRRLLQIPGTMDTKIAISYDCVVFRQQMALYHYIIDQKTDEPTDRVYKDNDHGPDAFRYFLHTRFGGVEVTLAMERMGPVPRPNNLMGMPSPDELAAFAGTQVYDNRMQFEQQQSKKKKDDDEGGGGGTDTSGGGFQFTFA